VGGSRDFARAHTYIIVITFHFAHIRTGILAVVLTLLGLIEGVRGGKVYTSTRIHKPQSHTYVHT